MIEAIKCIEIFFAVIAINIFWALGVRRTTEGKAWQAAFFGALTSACGIFVIRSYVENLFYAIPTVAGSFVGILLAIKLDTFKKRNAYRKN